MEAIPPAIPPPGKITVERNVALGISALGQTLHLSIPEAEHVFRELGEVLGTSKASPAPDEADELEAEWLSRIMPSLKAYAEIAPSAAPPTLSQCGHELIDLFQEHGSWEAVGVQHRERINARRLARLRARGHTMLDRECAGNDLASVNRAGPHERCLPLPELVAHLLKEFV